MLIFDISLFLFKEFDQDFQKNYIKSKVIQNLSCIL